MSPQRTNSQLYAVARKDLRMAGIGRHFASNPTPRLFPESEQCRVNSSISESKLLGSTDIEGDSVRLARGAPRDTVDKPRLRSLIQLVCSAGRSSIIEQLKRLHERQSASVKVRDRRPETYRDKNGGLRTRKPSPTKRRPLSDNCAGVARITLARLLGLLPAKTTYHGLARVTKEKVDALDRRISALPHGSAERKGLLKECTALLEKHTSLHGLRAAKHVKTFNDLWKSIGGKSGVQAVRTYATTDRPRATGRKAIFDLLKKGVPMAASLHACNKDGKIVAANWHHVLLVPDPRDHKSVYIVDPWMGARIKKVPLSKLMATGRRGMLGLDSRKNCSLGSFFLYFARKDGNKIPLTIKGCSR